MKIIILLYLTIINIIVNGQSWQWAINAQGHGSDYSWDISADNFGNSYITGGFYESLQFGNNITLHTDSNTWSSYVAKYDTIGNILWAKKFDWVSGIPYYLNGISIDTFQNCYIIGEFADSLNIDSTFITTTTYIDSCYDSLTGIWNQNVHHYQGIFIAKFNTNGNLIWLKKIGETKLGQLIGTAITIDNSENCYITGSFSDTITLNNNATLFTSNNYKDIFIAKTDNSGNLLWFNKVSGNGNNIVSDISIDKDGNSYITGTFGDTATFGAIILPTSIYHIFVAKFSINGNCTWVKKIDGPGSVHSITTDKLGNSIITGTFVQQLTLDSISLTSYANSCMFVAKYSSIGNCLWARIACGNIDCTGYSVAVDDEENCYITGQFLTVATFSNYTLSSNWLDVFVVKYDSLGTIKWVIKSDYSYSHTEGTSIALDSQGSIYVLGIFEYTTIFGSCSLSSTGSSDIFIAKLFDNTVGLVGNNITENSINVFPNPFSKEATISTVNVFKDATIIMYNSFGQLVKQINSIYGQEITLKCDNLPCGIYLIKILQDNKIISTDKVIIYN